jgi:uncharacterized metal-binding protein YceD (DUF177 family)
LAVRLGLIELPALAAAVRLRRARGGRYVEIDGSLHATVVQTCVVTLEPVPATLEEPFALLLGPIGGGAEDGPSSELIIDLDQPEPLESDTIDIGELVAQQLSLALDPYPRAPDAPAPEDLTKDLTQGLAEGPSATPAEPPAESPFAVLRARPGAPPKPKPKAK